MSNYVKWRGEQLAVMVRAAHRRIALKRHERPAWPAWIFEKIPGGSWRE